MPREILLHKLIKVPTSRVFIRLAYQNTKMTLILVLFISTIQFCIFSNLQCPSSVIITDVISVDNRAGVAPLIIGPDPIEHRTSKEFVRFENSLVVGMSPGFNCEEDRVIDIKISRFEHL